MTREYKYNNLPHGSAEVISHLYDNTGNLILTFFANFDVNDNLNFTMIKTSSSLVAGVFIQEITKFLNRAWDIRASKGTVLTFDF